MIDEEINTYATRIAGNKYIFQRGHAHRESNEIILCKQKVGVLECPAKFRENC